jgi:excinuclease ABC subunit C
LSSRLDAISGVGPKTRNKLLRKFGSLRKISAASVDEIRALGISQTVAQTVKFSLSKIDKERKVVNYQDKKLTE